MKTLILLVLIIVGPIPFLMGIGSVSDDPTFKVTVVGTAIVLMIMGVYRTIKKHRARKHHKKFMDAVIARHTEVADGK